MSSSQKSPKLVRKNLLDKLDLKKPLHSGYMFKQSHVPPKVFNKRFFVLYPKVLVYYDTESHFAKDVHTGSLAVRLYHSTEQLYSYINMTSTCGLKLHIGISPPPTQLAIHTMYFFVFKPWLL